jgi:hypothetical protein
MPNADQSSIAAGRKIADKALAKPTSRTKWSAGNGVSPGAILMEGDSWFDYPADDVPYILEVDYGYHVERVARRGDTMQSMATEPTQLADFLKRMKKMSSSGRMPKAILLSAGGNDVVGPEFGTFINHVNSGKPILNEEVYAIFLKEKYRPALISWLTAANTMSLQVLGAKRPIIIHGYDYAVPDGRGYNIGIDLSGPWMGPSFKRNGRNDLQANRKVVQVMISRLNELLSQIKHVSGLENVVHVDLRDSLSTGKDYRKWWANELHPTDEGFAIVTAKLHAVLARI